MRFTFQYLPGTGRGTASEAGGGGVGREAIWPRSKPLHRRSGGPPPRAGEVFAGAVLGACLLAACGAPDPAPTDNTAATTTIPLTNEALAAPAPAEPTPPFAEVDNAHPYTPGTAPIPAAFRGIWAESEALCGDLSHHSRLVISGATLRFPDFVIRADKVEQLGPRAINVVGRPEDGERRVEHHFSLDAERGTLTDEAGGGTVRVRCS